MNDRERARRFAYELSQTGWAFWATEAGEARVAAELADVRAEERARARRAIEETDFEYHDTPRWPDPPQVDEDATRAAILAALERGGGE